MKRAADGSGPGFTPKQGQYLAFIHTYTLFNRRPPPAARRPPPAARLPRPTCKGSCRSPRPRSTRCCSRLKKPGSSHASPAQLGASLSRSTTPTCPRSIPDKLNRSNLMCRIHDDMRKCLSESPGWTVQVRRWKAAASGRGRSQPSSFTGLG